MADHPAWAAYAVPADLPVPIVRDPALPLVSLVTPSYNQGHLIAHTIESILNHDYPNVEYWVIDGASTDGTLGVLRRYEGDPRLHWLSEPDSGQFEAINKGFARCQGEFVGWLNGDDVLLPGALRLAVDYLLAHPDVALVTGDIEEIDEQGRLIRLVPGEPFDLYRKVTDLMHIHQPGQLARGSVVRALGPLRTDLHYMGDVDWWLRMALSGAQIAYLPHPLAQLRRHPGTKMNVAAAKFWEEHERVLDGFFSHPGLPPEYLRWRRLAYSNSAIYHGVKLLKAGERRRAVSRLLRGVWLAPWRSRSVYALLLAFDALTGLHTWDWFSALRRRRAGTQG